MKRKQEKICTVSYVYLDGKSVVFGSDDEERFPPYPFSPEQRKKISRKLALTFLNELYKGQAVFYYADE